MDVVVAGGHGQIALRLLRLLAERGDRARGLVRNRDHFADIEAAGAEPVFCDMESETHLEQFIRGADALVFAAGAGPGSGAARKKTVDLGAALKLIEAARKEGTGHWVMVSAINTPRPERWAEEMRPYYEAKAEADHALEESGLPYTIVRPGRLTDDPGSGLVSIGDDLGRDDVPRDDVAAVLAAVLAAPELTRGRSFDLVAGDTQIDAALAGLA